MRLKIFTLPSIAKKSEESSKFTWADATNRFLLLLISTKDAEKSNPLIRSVKSTLVQHFGFEPNGCL